MQYIQMNQKLLQFLYFYWTGEGNGGDSVGMDYVSCSPFRVPIARVAAAQANLK